MSPPQRQNPFEFADVGTEEKPTPYPWRQWIFGDAHADSHDFAETVMQRAPKEIFCAGAASLLVSPIVSIIDKCIVQAGPNGSFMNACVSATKDMVARPGQFFCGLPFVLTATVYFGTYATANLSELFLDIRKVKDDDQRKTIKVGASAVANIGLLAWRDSIFAREYSAKTPGAKPKPSTPMRTLSLFAARDAATMYATFYAAPRAAEYLQEEYGVEQYTAELSMALAIPVTAQVITAPLHIHAMDYFNRPKVENGLADRMAAIKGEFKTVSFARGLRILPAFGIGSFSNNRLRDFIIRHEGEDMSRIKRRVTIAGDKIKRRLTA